MLNQNRGGLALGKLRLIKWSVLDTLVLVRAIEKARAHLSLSKVTDTRCKSSYRTRSNPTLNVPDVTHS